MIICLQESNSSLVGGTSCTSDTSHSLRKLMLNTQTRCCLYRCFNSIINIEFKFRMKTTLFTAFSGNTLMKYTGMHECLSLARSFFSNLVKNTVIETCEFTELWIYIGHAHSTNELPLAFSSSMPNTTHSTYD